MPALALSLPDGVMAGFLRGVVKPVMAPRFSFRAQRQWLAVTSGLNLRPLGIGKSKVSLGGVPTTVLAPQNVPLDGDPDRPVVLYLHGGAFCVGSPRTHEALAGWLAEAIDGPVYVPDYRLAPEHPYPAGREDALAAYNALVDLGIDPKRIVVAGDSAGGVMTADLGLDLAEGKGPQAAGLVLLSAAFALDAPRAPGVGDQDTLVSLPWARQATAAYGRPAKPAHAILGRDLTGLPPVHVQFSDQELLADDSRTFVAQLREAGAEPDVRIDTGAFHVMALLPGTMERSRNAVRAIATFVLNTTSERAVR